MPPVAARYVIDWLQDLGWAMQTGMGFVALTCTEIDAWMRATGTSVESWEFALIRTGSRAYVGQANSEDSTPPYEEQPHMNRVKPGAFKALAERLSKK